MIKFETIKKAQCGDSKAIKEILSIADKTFQLDPEEQFLNPVYLIKMYVIFGKQRTIELIQGKYGDLNYGTIALLMELVSIPLTSPRLQKDGTKETSIKL